MGAAAFGRPSPPVAADSTTMARYALGGSPAAPDALASASTTITPDEWAWMGGPTQTIQPGAYGGNGEPAPTNIPGSLWLFGGVNDTAGGIVNDQWRFVPSQHELYLPLLWR